MCIFLCLITAMKLLPARGNVVSVGATDILSDVQQPGDWTATGQVQVYTGGELIDYINGGAELYFAYNFKEACVREYRNDFGSILTVEIYEMDKSENAYGVYTFDTDGEHVEIGQDATYASGLLRFWKDRFFVRVLSAKGDENLRYELFLFGNEIANRIPDKGARPVIISKVPRDNVVSGSLQYFHKNVCLNSFYYVSDENILELSDKTGAVTYEYGIAEQILRVILVQYPTPEYAKDAYLGFNEAYFYNRPIRESELLTNSEFVGKVEEEKHTGIKLFNSYIIAVFEAENEDSCREMLDLQATQLQE